VAPHPPAKRKKEEKKEEKKEQNKGRKTPPVFDLSDLDSRSSDGSSSDGAQEMVGESKVVPPPP